jgi:hypothetical protein
LSEWKSLLVQSVSTLESLELFIASRLDECGGGGGVLPAELAVTVSFISFSISISISSPPPLCPDDEDEPALLVRTLLRADRIL